MIKKLGIGLIAIALAFFAFVYVQKGKLEEKLVAFLQNKSVVVAQSSVNLLPVPSVVLQNVHYLLAPEQQLSAQALTLDLSWRGILTGQIEIADIQLTQGEVRSNLGEFCALNGMLTPVNLSLSQLPALIEQWKVGQDWTEPAPQFKLQLSGENANNVQFNATALVTPHHHRMQLNDVQAEVNLQDARLFNTDKFHLSWVQGEVQWADNRYWLKAENAYFNQIELGSLLAQFEKQSIQQHEKITARLDIVNGQQEKAVLHYFPTEREGEYELNFSGENLSLASWLQAFNVPTLMTGNANAKVRLFSDGFLPKQGDIWAEITDGELSGLNLIELIGQYAPINYDEDKLQQKNLSTQFERAITHFSWQPAHIRVLDTELWHKHFVLRSEGEIDLTQGQCDVHSEISLTDARYEALRLPVHFFGDCKSPQYKVKFNRTFRNQLKNLIREKLK